MVVRVVPTVFLTAVLLAGLTPPASAQGGAALEDVEFTVIVDDAADYAASGFLDVREIAVGEPGDETVVFRILPEDVTDVPPAEGSIHLWFSTAAGAFRSGVTSAGAPSSTNPFDSCAIVAPHIYCVMSYGTLGVGVGGVIQGMYVISYFQLAQDFAPGGLYADACLAQCLAGLQERGSDYTLVGSTAVGEDAPDLPEVFYEDLPDGDVLVEGEVDEPTTGTFIFNWTTDLESVLLEYAAEVAEGSVRLSVVDGAGEELVSADITATIELNETLDATAGDWQFIVEFTDFLGYFGFTATAAPAAPEVPGPGAPGDAPVDGSTPAGDTNATADPGAGLQEEASVKEKAESPGAGLVVLVAALAVALLLRRR